MSEFEFPTNIKQIGSIGDGMRIYMEDYVCTYLQQFAEAGGYEERIALLIGRNMVLDGVHVMFISGAIQGMYTVAEKGITTFTDQSMSYAYEQMKKYFRGLEIVGWMQSQPSYGVLLNSNYANYHANTFAKPNQVLFIMDPIENINAFYVWDSEAEDLKETWGYFVYYDKNRGMHEYMLANSGAKPKPSIDLTSKMRVRDYIEEYNEAEEQEDYENEEPEPVKMKYVEPRVRKRRTDTLEHKRAINMLVSLSAVLVLVCFIMGAGLIQNEGRITNLESQLTTLSTSYRDFVLQVRDGKTASVFAAQQEDRNESAEVLTENGKQLSSDNMATPTPVKTPEPVTASPSPSPSPTPAPTEKPAPAQTTNVPTADIPNKYTIERGDNLTYISLKFYGTTQMVEKIMEVNGMNDADTLYFGKVIKLPTAE